MQITIAERGGSEKGIGVMVYKCIQCKQLAYS